MGPLISAHPLPHPVHSEAKGPPSAPAARTGPHFTLYRYFARETASPILFSLAGLTLVVLTDDLLGYTDLVINRGLNAGTVAWIAFYQTVPLVARTLPFAVLLGCLIALGRLGADRELLALETTGVSAVELVGPVVVVAAAATAVGFGLSIFGAAWANRTLDHNLEQLSREKPGVRIAAGTVHHFGDWKLEAREVSSSGERMRGVLLWVPDVGETIFAERGALEPSADGSTVVVLENGIVLLNPRRLPSQIRFERMRTGLPETNRPITREDSSDFDSAKPRELIALAKSAEAFGDEIRRARTELNRRVALPTAALVFGLLAVPLALSRGTFSRAGGAMLGIAATVVYYGLVQLGDGLIQGRWVGPALGVWLPNLALGLPIPILIRRLGRICAYGRDARRPRGAKRSSGDHLVPKQTEGRTRSRRWALQRYIGRRFLEMAVLSFGVLLVAYLLVDVLERLDFFARYAAPAAEILRFYGARIPLLTSRVVPMALLVATALTVGLLAAQNELLAMRSCGIFAPRALLPILILCAVIAPAYFILDNKVVPPANALARYLKNVEIKGRTPEERARDAVWYRIGDHLYEAERFDPQMGRARRITIYQLSEGGLPVSRTDARSARYVGHGIWRLIDPVRLDSSRDTMREVSAERFADLGEGVPAEVDTRELSIGELGREIREVEEAGYDATAYRVDLYAKMAAPLACLVLPALALFFAVAGPIHPSSAVTLLFSSIVAISYILLSGVGASLGYGGKLPPVVAGAGPTVLFALLAAYYGLHPRGFGRFV